MFSKNLNIFQKIPKIWTISENLKNFWKSENFLSAYLKTFQNSENFQKIWIFFWKSENSQVMSPHHSDQMSQRSQVSGVALCMSIADFLRTLRFSENSQIFWEFSDFLKILNFLKILRLLKVFFSQVMSPHHSDQMPQRSQVSRVTL